MPRPEIPAELELYVVTALREGSEKTFSLLNERLGAMDARLKKLEDELVGRKAVRGFMRHGVDALVGALSFIAAYLAKHFVFHG